MTCVVNPGPDGHIPIEPYGGRRRVDRLLVRDTTTHRSHLAGYAFATTLTNLTDHLPVCMSLRVAKHHVSHQHSQQQLEEIQ
jgi:hypothetical protein